MRIRSILGEIVTNNAKHGLAKTESGKFVAGEVSVGQLSSAHAQFDTLSAAFYHWYETLPTNTMQQEH